MKEVKTRPVGKKKKSSQTERKTSQSHTIFHYEIMNDEDAALFLKIQQEHYEDAVRYDAELKKKR